MMSMKRVILVLLVLSLGLTTWGMAGSVEPLHASVELATDNTELITPLAAPMSTSPILEESVSWLCGTCYWAAYLVGKGNDYAQYVDNDCDWPWGSARVLPNLMNQALNAGLDAEASFGQAAQTCSNQAAVAGLASAMEARDYAATASNVCRSPYCASNPDCYYVGRALVKYTAAAGAQGQACVDETINPPGRDVR